MQSIYNKTSEGEKHRPGVQVTLTLLPPHGQRAHRTGRLDVGPLIKAREMEVMTALCEDLWIFLRVALEASGTEIVLLLLRHEETGGGGPGQSQLLHAATRRALVRSLACVSSMMAMLMDAVENISGGEGGRLVHLFQRLCRGSPVKTRATNPPVPARACRWLTASRC